MFSLRSFDICICPYSHYQKYDVEYFHQPRKLSHVSFSSITPTPQTTTLWFPSSCICFAHFYPLNKSTNLVSSLLCLASFAQQYFLRNSYVVMCINCFFFFLQSIPLYKYIKMCLSILLPVFIWIVSTLRILCIRPMNILVQSFCGHMFSFPWINI